MGLYEARGNLNKGYKDLLLKWQYVKTLWDDEQAKQVEDQTLVQIERDVKSATEAMDTMTNLCSSARRECAPTS